MGNIAKVSQEQGHIYQSMRVASGSAATVTCLRKTKTLVQFFLRLLQLG